MRDKKIIIGLGEILWDIYPNAKYLGGAPANVVIHAQRLGGQGVIVSAVGADDLGAEIIAALQNQKMDVSHIQKNPSRPTGTVRVSLDEKGNPHFKCSSNTAFDAIQWCDELFFLADADAVVFGTLAQRSETSQNTIQRFLDSAQSVLKVFDVNFRGWQTVTEKAVRKSFPKTDILKMNESELHTLQKVFGYAHKESLDFLNWLLEKYDLKMIAVSLGPNGCILINDAQHFYSPGFVVDVIDTIGCGDGFVAALTLGFLKSQSLKEIAEYANLVGAFLSTKRGAAPNYTMNELDQFACSLHDRCSEKLEKLLPLH